MALSASQNSAQPTPQRAPHTANQRTRPIPSTTADKVGACASMLCAIHCMLTPFIMLAIPTFGVWWASSSVHITAAALVIPLALLTLFFGMKQHRRSWPFILGILGCACLIVALLPFLPSEPPIEFGANYTGTNTEIAMNQTAHNVATNLLEPGSPVTHCTNEACCPVIITEPEGWSLTIPWEALLTIIGSLFLVTSHIGNLRYSKKTSS